MGEGGAAGVAILACIPPVVEQATSPLGDATRALGVFLAIVVGVAIGATLMKRSRHFGTQFMVYPNGIYYQEQAESTFIRHDEITRSRVKVATPVKDHVEVLVDIRAQNKKISTSIVVPRREVDSVVEILRGTKGC